MLNKRLVEMLRLLDAGERKRFRQFLQSPYFTSRLSHQEILRLYDYILKASAGADAGALDKKTVSLRLFPRKPFRENGKNPVDTLTSGLLRLLRQFLFQQEIERDTSEPRKLLATARFYSRFGLEDRFQELARHMRTELDKTALRDEHYYLERFQIEEALSSQKISNVTRDDANLGHLSDWLEHYFAIKEIQIANARAFYNHVIDFQGNPGASTSETCLALIRQGRLRNDPLIQAYSKMLASCQAPGDEEHLADFEQMLDTHTDRFSAQDRQNLTTGLRNLYHMAYLKTNKMAFLVKMFELSIQHLNAGYSLYNGKILANNLNNYVFHGLNLGYLEQVEQILRDFPPERIAGTPHARELHDILQARVLLAHGRHAEAQQRITYQAFENPLLELNAEVLLIQILFETHSEILDHRIQALRQKIRRSIIPKHIKIRYTNFLGALERLQQYKWTNNTRKMDKLRAEITATPHVAHKSWLLEHMKAMETNDNGRNTRRG